MATIFISGSRKLGRLNPTTREKLDAVIQQNHAVLLGDANGSDKAVQTFFSDANYPHVTVYCAGNLCRNNVGQWPLERITVPKGLKGRAYYTVKDKAMAKAADKALVLWDGKSVGSVNNMQQMLHQQKEVDVYLSPQQETFTLTTMAQLHEMFDLCEPEAAAEIKAKMDVLPDDELKENEPSQISLL